MTKELKGENKNMNKNKQAEEIIAKYNLNVKQLTQRINEFGGDFEMVYMFYYCDIMSTQEFLIVKDAVL